MIYLLTFLICFASALLQGVVGFGFAVFSMFLLPLFIPLPQAAAIICVQTFFMGWFIAIKLRKVIDFKTAWVPLVLSIVTVPIGIYMLTVMDEGLLKKILGVVFLLIAALMFVRQNRDVKVTPSTKNGIVYGSLSGIISGMFNVGGPVLVVYYFYAIPGAMAYKATLEFSFVLRSLSTIISHGVVGNYSQEAIYLSALGVAGTIIGSIIGLKLYSKVPRKLLQKLTSFMMIVMGLILIIG